MNKEKNKRGQEEMVGFIVIVVIVSVVMLVLLGFLLRSPSTSAVQNYEVESFIQAGLQYTSSCENQIEFLPVQDLIVSCEGGETCLDGEDSCKVLNETLKNIVESGWNVKEGSAVKGYEVGIMVEKTGIFSLQKGNQTSNYKGAFQNFAKRGKSYEIYLNVYY